MNKKLGRLLRPALGGYLIIMLGFALASALFQNYLLAGIELAVTLLALAAYQMNRASRRRKLQDFIQKHLDEINGTEGTKTPFPVLVLRLADGDIVYANDAFLYFCMSDF